MSHADIIARYGTAEIAERLDVPAAHVRVWKNRRIPRSAYAELMDVFPGLTLAELKAGEPGHNGGSVEDPASMPAADPHGAENPGANISRTGVAA